MDNYIQLLPIYKVGKEGLEKTGELLLPIVKGSKSNTIQEGVITQDLIKSVINYLEEVNQGEMRTKETSVAIIKLEEAWMWLEKRTKDRQKRNVLNTYNK